MKTSLVIVGVGLLLLSVATADELERKQIIDCLYPNTDTLTCVRNIQRSPNALCSSECRSVLTEYYEDCIGDVGLETFKTEYDNLCGDAATVGAVLFTTVSAVLVAVTTALS